jgi:hypothetical protein
MMKALLLFIAVVTALFFYINSNSEIDTVEGDLNNSTKLETKEMVVNQDKVGMGVSEVDSQVTAGLMVVEELDIVMRPVNKSLSLPNDLLAGGIDDIGGYYDVNARSPASESQQYNDLSNIGIDASDVLTPEMDFDYIDIEGSSPSIGKSDASSEPPEGNGK